MRIRRRTKQLGIGSRAGAPGAVVVTGAAGGVGRAVAHAFARPGARVALVARDEAALHGVEREVRGLGDEGVAVPADVAVPGQVEAAAQRAEGAFGDIDVW